MKLPRDGEYFDHVVGVHGDFNPFTEDGWDLLRRRFAEASRARRGLRVLDVGCGTGRSRHIYEQQSSLYLGIDLSRRALTLACSRSGEHVWVQGDALHLPVRDGSLDVVAFSSVLHHIGDMDAALRAAVRALSPGGLVFAFDPNVLHPAMLLFRHPRSPLYRPEGVSPHEKPLHPHVLTRAFARAGLGYIGQRRQSGIAYRAVAPRGLNALLHVYNRIDRLWEGIGAGRVFGTFVITWGWKPDLGNRRAP